MVRPAIVCAASVFCVVCCEICEVFSAVVLGRSHRLRASHGGRNGMQIDEHVS